MSSSTVAKAAAPFGLRQLLGLAWPVILARATQSVIGFSDALMVAPLGEEPLAAVTTGALNTFALIIFPMGTVFIVQSFTAQLRGRNELGSVKRYAFYGLAFALLAGLIALATIPFIPAILGSLGYAPEVHRLMSQYLMIRLLSVGPAVGIEALGNWYGGLGNTRAAMVAGVVAMVANVLGCYALIEPRFGLPGYGVAGSAWASV
jgi:MATE family multidrug resistance protein